MDFKFLQKLNSYQIAIGLSSTSMAFGLLREFLIVGILGFSSQNDILQIYLSIFYTIGMTIDAIRLSCLNLYSKLTLAHMIIAVTCVALPFTVLIAFAMSFATHHTNFVFFILTIFGGYLNLIAALLITYKQRENIFLPAQVINVLPNFVLIPGILIWNFLGKESITFGIILLTTIIPFIQCLLLLLLKNKSIEKNEKNSISIFKAVGMILRHFTSTLGEQIFQIIIRAAFFQHGPGYLSMYAIFIRVYSAFRFILIDSYIGSKLGDWKKNFNAHFFVNRISSSKTNLILTVGALVLSISGQMTWNETLSQMVLLLFFSFYFSILVRIVYFKINHHENNNTLILRFASFELTFALLAYLLTQHTHYPLLFLVWLGYVMKPFIQLLLLRKRFFKLAVNVKNG